MSIQLYESKALVAETEKINAEIAAATLEIEKNNSSVTPEVAKSTNEIGTLDGNPDFLKADSLFFSRDENKKQTQKENVQVSTSAQNMYQTQITFSTMIQNCVVKMMFPSIYPLTRKRTQMCSLMICFVLSFLCLID